MSGNWGKFPVALNGLARPLGLAFAAASHLPGTTWPVIALGLSAFGRLPSMPEITWEIPYGLWRQTHRLMGGMFLAGRLPGAPARRGWSIRAM